MTSDAHELETLIGDLQSAPFRALAQIRALMDETGREIRDDARLFAPKTRLPHYAEAITHSVDADGLGVVIGPVKGGQGSLGHLFEYGVASRGIPPHAHLGPALDRAIPDFAARVAAISVF